MQEPNDFRWLKSLPEKTIDEFLGTLNVRPHNDLMLQQKVVLMLCLQYDFFFPMLDMGTGKTLIGLESTLHRKKKDLGHRTFVFVPNKANLYEWESQVQKHTPQLSITVMDGSTKQRKAQLDSEDSDIFVLNYAGLIPLFATKTKRYNSYKNKKETVWVPKSKEIDAISRMFSGFIADESTTIKNPDTYYYKIAYSLSRRALFRYAFSGTPFGRNPFDLFSQFKFCDDGETLGKSPNIYKKTFFRKVNNGFGIEWVFDKRKKNKLNTLIQNRSIYYSRRECMVLPEASHHKAIVLPTKEISTYYNKIVQTVIDKADNEFTNNSFMGMRQLTSGFVVVHDRENERNSFELPCNPNPKLDRLKELIEEIPNENKIIVFQEFIYSGQQICKLLKEMKIGHHWLYSGTKDRRKVLFDFNNDPTCRVLVANNKSAAMGLNVQAANYGIYYESPVSPIFREQTEGRLLRKGQELPCFYIDIIMKGSVDEKILEFLKEGKDLMKALVNPKKAKTLLGVKL